MDAHFARRACARWLASVLAIALVPILAGASFRSTNFAVDAPTREIAERVAKRAEECRLAICQSLAGSRACPPGRRPVRCEW